MSTSTGRQTHCQRLHSQSKTVNSGPVKVNDTNIKSFKIRSGLTLIEILIALTMTLIVLGAMAQAFKFASGEIAEGRSILELANRLRNAEQLLRRDLAGLTVEVRPHTENAPNGYFEYIEGVLDDKDPFLDNNIDNYTGDVDDILAFTSTSLEGEFRGRYGTQILQSTQAEIIWFTERNDTNGNNVLDFTETATVNRRVLLIAPYLNGLVTGSAFDLPYSTGEDIPGNVDPNVNSALRNAIEFFVENDISARWVDTNNDGNRDTIIANGLVDLGRRENRFGRDTADGFPFEILSDGLSTTRMGVADFSTGTFETTQSGDEIVLSNVAGFDLQIYSPNALVRSSGNIALNSSDVGFANAPGPGVAHGGFVDLALGNNFATAGAFELDLPQFATAPVEKPAGAAAGAPWDFATYCTWSPHYESDGIDQDGDGLIDEGRNGIDEDSSNGVDDDGEAETAPPYPFAARGIKATFRVIEKNTKQVRQTSVIHNFSKM